MKNEPHSPVNAPQPIKGEAIPCRKYQSLSDFCACVMGMTAAILILIFGLTDGSWFAISFASGLFICVAISLFHSFYLLAHKERLILGEDRIQHLRGRRVLWEIPYDNIGEVRLFRTPLPPTPAEGLDLLSLAAINARWLGINLLVPEAFDQAWPRIGRRRKWTRNLRGCDFAFPTFGTGEHPERLLEVVLICYHRFKANEADKVIT